MSGRQEGDLALIKLNRKVEFVKKENYWKITSLCLPKKEHTNTQDELGLIAGWGVTNMNSTEFARALRIAWIKIQATTNDVQDDFGNLIVVKRTTNPIGSIACFVRNS